jgi:hypothetical protein
MEYVKSCLLVPLRCTDMFDIQSKCVTVFNITQSTINLLYMQLVYFIITQFRTVGCPSSGLKVLEVSSQFYLRKLLHCVIKGCIDSCQVGGE